MFRLDGPLPRPRSFDTAEAIESYERSLELDPRNRNAEERLRTLRGGG